MKRTVVGEGQTAAELISNRIEELGGLAGEDARADADAH